MVTHQLQVERRTGKVRRPETDVLPLCHATKVEYTDIAVRSLTCHTATGTRMPYGITQCYPPLLHLQGLVTIPGTAVAKVGCTQSTAVRRVATCIRAHNAMCCGDSWFYQQCTPNHVPWCYRSKRPHAKKASTQTAPSTFASSFNGNAYLACPYIYIFIRINCSSENKRLKNKGKRKTHNVSKNTARQMHTNNAQRKRKIT